MKMYKSKTKVRMFGALIAPGRLLSYQLKKNEGARFYSFDTELSE